MLTYSEVTTVTVWLEGKVVGHIKEVIGGWCYFPKDCSKEWAGEIYTSLKAVKMSLEN